MTDRTPDQIRQALDVLGIDSEDIRGTYQGRCWDALLAAVRALSDPPVPVSRDTPAGTEVERPELVEGRWTVIGHATKSQQFMAESIEEGHCQVFYYDGWVEVRRPDPELDPEFEALLAEEAEIERKVRECYADPIPVEVGQTRLMPVKVKGDYGGSGWLVEFATGHDLNVQDSLVASWTPQEET